MPIRYNKEDLNKLNFTNCLSNISSIVWMLYKKYNNIHEVEICDLNLVYTYFIKFEPIIKNIAALEIELQNFITPYLKPLESVKVYIV